MLHLILAGIWLGLAALAFAQPMFDPGNRAWNLPNTSISIGWLALILFVYNVIRWRSSRLATRHPPSGRRPEEPERKPIDAEWDLTRPRPSDEMK